MEAHRDYPASRSNPHPHSTPKGGHVANIAMPGTTQRLAPPAAVPPAGIDTSPQPNKLVENLSELLGQSQAERLAALEFYRKHKGNFRDKIIRDKQPVTWKTLAIVMKESWLSQPETIKRRYLMHGHIACLLWARNPHNPWYRPQIPVWRPALAHVFFRD